MRVYVFVCVQSGLECCPKANPEARPPKRKRIYTFMYIRTYINIHTGVYRWYLRTGSPESGFNGKRERERKKKSKVRKTKRKNTRSPVVHFERNRRKKATFIIRC